MTHGVPTVVSGHRNADVEHAVSRVLSSSGNNRTRLEFVHNQSGGNAVQAVVAWTSQRPSLTDVCAHFEHFGLLVMEQVSIVEAPPEHSVSLFDFNIPQPWNAQRASKVAAAFEAADLHGFSVDHFAGLIVAANVNWREVMLIRSASRFLRQAGLPMSEKYVVATLRRHCEFVAGFARYFAARFDPETTDRAHATSEALDEQTSAIEATTSVDEDRILRAFFSFASATLRTNWFQRDPEGSIKPYASFMLDSSLLDSRGPIVPYREIFVDSDAVEGIHARTGQVARGGIRFSDRPEDYRTEVLGLMKTQAVKNSPIVPVGAKGAFVRKDPEISVEQAYRTFIAGLLDVTDNLVNGEAQTPPRTVTYGSSNSYLVVAADKGTARFSDLANTMATARGFWLGDAFASGGSAGYDHKKMGITARGAWVAVRRHFAELGMDADSDTLRVVGIGDMAGDVFGNGLLLSDRLKLVAAFDHRHIFIDPDPDPDVSFRERRRLAGLPASCWADYDLTTLSTGGAVWPRAAKRVALSEEARHLLELTATTLTPNDVIRAILAADVDLLWNGGIGTYVKSTRETHADAADPANDAIRINADRLHATVVGEGGNLGLTQRARIDFALAGGRVNTDFIDNAAGVATSDREVNLKIALDGPHRAGLLSMCDRDDLLALSQGEVTEAVLTGCENQILAITLAETQAPHLLNRHERMIENLESANGIDRAAEILPTKAELVSRTREGRGLTRPEISVLLALAKNIVRDELLQSDLPDNPAFATTLAAYFPSPIRHLLPHAVESHRLAREIIATQIADDLLNHVGPGLIYQLEDRLGVPTPAVAAAYTVVRELFGVDDIWSQARDAAEYDPRRWEVLHDVQLFIEHAAVRLLRHHGSRLEIGATIERYRSHLAMLAAHPHGGTESSRRLRLEVFDLSETATRLNLDINRAAFAYLALEEQLDLDFIGRGLAAHRASTWWDAMSAASVRDQLTDAHHRLTAGVLALHDDFDRMLELWRAGAATHIDRLMRIRAELGRDGVVDVPRAATVLSELVLLCRQTELLGTRPRSSLAS